MADFAVLDNENIVVNVILADSLEVAEELTGSKCIEFNPLDGVCAVGSTWTGSEFTRTTIGAPPQGEPSNPN